MTGYRTTSGFLKTFFGSLTRKRASRQFTLTPSAMLSVAETLESRELLTANPVLNWNEVLLDAIRIDRTAPPNAARAMALVQTAIYDAVNSIDQGHEAYLVQVAASADASKEAAVAAAGQRTLTSLFPAQQATFDAAFAATLAAIPDGLSESRGVAVGQSVADQILTRRGTDYSTATVTYTPGTVPGDWRPTPEPLAPALLPQWPNVDCWGIESGSQFRPGAPPALTSETYAFDLNEVQDLGSATSTSRTADQTNIARFWAGGPGTATPPGQWNMIAQTVARSEGITLEENARLFALLNIALADAAITSWDAKYEYNLWRPITAIREADTDGNAATVADAAWTPLLNTPAFPSYTSGHSTFSGAASTILADFFGNDDVAFTLPSEVTGVPERSYTTFSLAAEEAGASRIFGGIHYRFDNTVALATGRSVGAFIVDHLLEPVFLRMNAGGPAIPGNTPFQRDTRFQNGAGRDYRTDHAINLTAVSAGIPEKLFQSNLFDPRGGRDLQFRIPTRAGATYRVELYFSELWSGAFRTGARKFDIALEGNTVLQNLDIFSEAGGYKGLMKSFDVRSDGTLNIQLLRRIGDPSIAGIQLIELATNSAPTITPIANQTINEDSNTSALAFTVNDADGDTVTVTATSSNHSLLPNDRIVIAGTGNDRAVTATPRANRSGTTVITLKATDGFTTTIRQFTLTVNAVNDAPTMTAIADLYLNGDQSLSIPFQVADVDNAALAVTAVVGNPQVVTSAVIRGTGAHRRIVLGTNHTPGISDVTITVNDGTQQITETFTVNVGLMPNAGGGWAERHNYALAVTPMNFQPTMNQPLPYASHQRASLRRITGAPEVL